MKPIGLRRFGLSFGLLAAVAALVVFEPAVAQAQLKRMRYNHDGLTVDLGVGLWAWPLPMDYDGDGDFDLVVSCPDKPYNGTYFFENPGKGESSGGVSKMPVFKPGVRVGRGHTNIQVSFVDGQPRVLVPGAEVVDLRSATNRPENGFTTLKPVYKTGNVHTFDQVNKVRANQWRYVDYDGDGKLDVVVGVEDWEQYGWDDAFDGSGKWTRDPLHGYIYLLRNQGTTESPDYEAAVKLKADGKPIDSFGMPSPTFADFDGDGDLDLITGEFLDGFTYYENTGSRTEPTYAAGRRLPVRMDLQMITPVGIDWDRDGDIDLICGDEDGRVALIENTGRMLDGVPALAGPAYFQQEAADVKFGALVTPLGVDWDGDGDDDLICGNTAGYIGFIENLGVQDGQARWARPKYLEVDGVPARITAGPNGSIQGPAEAKWGYTTLSVADWDGDGLHDIVLNNIWGKVLWHKNIGSKTRPKLAAAMPVEVQWDAAAPKPEWNWWNPDGRALVSQWRTTPHMIDWNSDGLTDLVMSDHEGYLVLFQREKRGEELVLLPGQRIFVGEDGQPFRLSAERAGRSGRRKFCLTDWDRDGRVDLLLNSTNVTFYRNVEQSDDRVVLKDQGLCDARVLAAHDTSPTVADLDGDGIKELVVGAEDGFFYVMQNPNVHGRASQSGIVASEYIYENGPVAEVHASTIVDTPAGLVAGWFGGVKEGSDDVVIWVRRQVNGRWTPAEIAAVGVDGEKRYPCWNPVLYQAEGQELALYYKVGPSPSTWWGMVKTSKDHGATWSEAVRLPDGVLGPIKNKPLQLASGEIISPSSTEHDGWRVQFELSGDGGRSWTVVAPKPYSQGEEPGAIQPAILQHKDGTLEALCRPQSGEWILTTRSTDGGRTWSELRETELPNPESGIDAMTLADGRQLLVYNHSTRGRSPLNVAVSDDDGKTWRAAIALEGDRAEFSYPYVIQAADGRLHITYTSRRQKIQHVTIDPSRLGGPEIVNGVWPE